MGFRLAIVGATGMVGRTMRDIVSERGIQPTDFLPVASAKSVGEKVQLGNASYPVVDMATALKAQPDIALFSAGGEVSRQWAPEFTKRGTVVIDNSSAWRMDEGVKLVVPEVNGHLLDKEDVLIANPNCSTIQLVMILHPLQKVFGLQRVVISTYQSVTGTGKKAVDQLLAEERGEKPVDSAYPHPIHRNALPHCDSFQDNGYTKEELKLLHESRKILAIPDLPVSATAVRVPVIGGHAESVTLDLKTPFSLEEVRNLLAAQDGVKVEDDPMNERYPMPVNAAGKDAVFVGRIRRDAVLENCMHLFIVADNLRKGAATNAVQIMEEVMRLRGLK